MIVATIKITAPSEKRKELLQTFKAILDPIRREPGCISCDCYVDVEAEDNIIFDGNSKSVTISEAMGMTFSPVSLIVPKTILTQQFIDQLTPDTGTVVAFLKQNDSYRDPQSANATWVPTVPIRMIHHPSDELVPYGNSQAAFNAFKAASAASTVELIAETAIINIPSDSVKTVHYGSAFPELIDGWKWLDSFKK